MANTLRTQDGAEPACYQGGRAKNRLIINSNHLTLEAASLQWMEGKKELSMRTSRSLTTFSTCMELPGLPVERDNISRGARPIAM